jgi:PKD repeat protein
VTGWSWTFGDGGTSTAKNPSRTYAAAGTYSVTLTVTDNAGATNQFTTPVAVTAPTGPQARFSDSFNRVVASGVGTADGGSDANKTWVTWEGANADVAVDGSALVLKKDTGGWRALVGSESAANLDATVEVSAFNSNAALFGLYLRVAGGPANNYQFQWTQGALTIWRSTTAAGDVVLATVPKARNSSFKFRAQVETVGSSVVLRLKYWTGVSEPTGWTLTATDTSPGRILSGGYALRAINGGTSDMRIDNFIVNNLVAQPNQLPQANFTLSCTDLACSFTDGSTDTDGSVTGWSWTFGDGGTSTAKNPSRTYAAAGTYSVTLTVTDNAGATNQFTTAVTVTAPTGPQARLSDSFNRVVASGVGTADGGSDASKTWVTWEGANADVTVDGSALVLKKDTGGWRALVGSESPANLDATVEVSAFNSDAALFGLYLRVAGGPADNYQFQWTGGTLTIWRSTRTGGDVVLATVPKARNAAFKLRAQVETVGSSVVLRLKYWTGASEPSAWTLTATDTSPGRILSGGYALRAINGGTSDMRIDNFVINNLATQQP